MHTKKIRFISLFLVAATVMSLLSLPALASQDSETESAEPAREIVSLTSDGEDSSAPPEEAVDVDVIPAADLPSAEEPPSETEPAAAELPADDSFTAEPESAEPEPATDISAENSASGEIVSASDEPDMDGDGTWTVSYYSGETLISEETVADGASPTEFPQEDINSVKINGWLTKSDDSGKFVTVSKQIITADISYYAWYAPTLETTEHMRYINGTGNACFEPENTLTRAQAATILYNLMTNKVQGDFSSVFTDVPSGSWYYEAVSTLASWKVITGDGDGTFRPDDDITRAEFVTMVVRLSGIENRDNTFADVSGHWASDSIATAAYRGWVNGYDDEGKSVFLPDNSIKRAEAVTIINRYLGRSADENTLATGGHILAYLDVEEDAWYYPQVMEASIGHEYNFSGGGETWTQYNYESCGLSAGAHTIDGKHVWVDSEYKQLIRFTSNIMRDGTHYLFSVSPDTFYYICDLSTLKHSKMETDGLKIISGVMFYWDATEKAPRHLSAGVNDLGDDYGYYADEDGFVIRNDFSAGVVELNGKKYLANVSQNGACSIITKYYDPSEEAYVSAAGHTYEYSGTHGMYYIQSDYSLLCDGNYGYLYFGPDGKYTSGDTELDGYIYSFISSVLSNNALTDVQKLLKVYYLIRGGDAETYGKSQFTYIKMPQGYAFGSYTDGCPFAVLCAKQFWEGQYGKQGGMCYQWACFYLMCARRLGFQCYPVVGTVFSNPKTDGTIGDRHCWCMIKWNGKWHISDVEVEWGYISKIYSSNSIYWNLFDQEYTPGTFKYTNPKCSTIVYRFYDHDDDSLATD